MAISFANGIFQAAIGMILLGGARSIVEFSYPLETAADSESHDDAERRVE